MISIWDTQHGINDPRHTRPGQCEKASATHPGRRDYKPTLHQFVGDTQLTTAMLVNEGLVLHVCDDLRRRYDLSRMTVGLLGMAFKADIDDTRASLSYKFKKALAGLCEAVVTTDPFVTTDPDLLPLDEVIKRSDLLILCAPHSAYRDLDYAGKPVVDVWGFLTKANVIA